MDYDAEGDVLYVSFAMPQQATDSVMGTVFWMSSGAGTELTVAGFLEQFQIRRDGGQRGIVEVEV